MTSGIEPGILSLSLSLCVCVRPSVHPSVRPSQAQHSHHVIQQVLDHLDTHGRNTPRVRAGIVQVVQHLLDHMVGVLRLGRTDGWTDGRTCS